MKKNIMILCLGMLIIAAGCSSEEETQVLEKKPIEVEIYTVSSGTITQHVQYKGSVSPWRRANIQPDVSGRIEKIYKKPGDLVKKGDLLAELDATTLKLQEKQAMAAFNVANASFKDAQLNFKRMEKLYAKRAVSQMQFEKAQLGLEAADTQKKSAEANLNVIRHTLNNAYMKAPFSGIVTNKYLEEGDMINPMMGMTPGVLTVMDLNQVKILLDIPSEDIEKIQVGQPCIISLESRPDEQFSGDVYSKNLAADPVSKTFKVEIRMANDGLKAKSGIFAEVAIEYMHKENVISVPLSAVVNDTFVILNNGGKAKKQQVEVGLRNEKICEILNGLSDGDQVVVDGNYDLKDGYPLQTRGDGHENR